jgi:hypothetical protein
MIACRADHVGSMLRPSEFISAREDAATYSPAPDADDQTLKWIPEHEYRRDQNPCRTADRID